MKFDTGGPGDQRAEAPHLRGGDVVGVPEVHEDEVTRLDRSLLVEAP